MNFYFYIKEIKRLELISSIKKNLAIIFVYVCFRREVNDINHNHVIFIWSAVGCQVMALFRQIIKRIQASNNITALTSLKNNQAVIKENDPETFSASTQPSEISSLLKTEELELLRVAVKFVFLSSLVTCFLKKPGSEDSEVTNGGRSVNEMVERKAREDLAEREACAERRGMRRALVEEGVFHLIGTLMDSDDDNIKVRDKFLYQADDQCLYLTYTLLKVYKVLLMAIFLYSLSSTTAV